MLAHDELSVLQLPVLPCVRVAVGSEAQGCTLCCSNEPGA